MRVEKRQQELRKVQYHLKTRRERTRENGPQKQLINKIKLKKIKKEKKELLLFFNCKILPIAVLCSISRPACYRSALEMLSYLFPRELVRGRKPEAICAVSSAISGTVSTAVSAVPVVFSAEKEQLISLSAYTFHWPCFDRV